jgi:mannitol/fructose-specific phosphotransferase system IIA component (Ntr-type)
LLNSGKRSQATPEINHATIENKILQYYNGGTVGVMGEGKIAIIHGKRIEILYMFTLFKTVQSPTMLPHNNMV